MLDARRPALVLAPMDGITDAPMRDLQGEIGAFTYCVTEFVRVSQTPVPAKVFRREVPELLTGARTSTGLSVQVQILGGHPERMAQSAASAVRAGATAIDINFGCPAPTVNRNDGGATLLQYPHRIREVVAAVRAAVPAELPVSAKLRLGWDDVEAIHVNAAMAAEGGASWLTIHARTRSQGYAPPVFWRPIGVVHRSLGLPVVANGDIWTLDDFRRCRDETGVQHFMLGRSALSNPALSHGIAAELGMPSHRPDLEWGSLFRQWVSRVPEERKALARLKQWISLAHRNGDFPWFHDLKRCESTADFLAKLADMTPAASSRRDSVATAIA